MLEGQLLLFGQQPPPVGHHSGHLARGQEGEPLADQVSEFLREVDEGLQGLLWLQLGICLLALLRLHWCHLIHGGIEN